MSEHGWLAVVGVGPGDPGWITPETTAILGSATDLVGYAGYVERVADSGHTRHVSDNREELTRAGHALDLAASGARVAVISGGDPGIFAMAAALWEAIERADHDRWQAVDVRIAPAVSAIQAVAARAGAPLGNDFCVISLSDNLKPWAQIEKRIDRAADADFAMAFYNPISRARRWQLGAAMAVIRGYRDPATPVVLGRAVGRADEALQITDLARFSPGAADMSTLVVVGASTTRVIEQGGGRRVYTPRYYPDT
ncbi:precorrin-3B C(17)-methyltransferase [Salinisphaera sp. SPP-AMP-43]|uniref:precorrin-3B C(17)-methyltransferase n=1 Tax=Salinisphaera sp. SPP-AMP-43 TaxID=3121288 RepID=UPI003C6DD833